MTLKEHWRQYYNELGQVQLHGLRSENVHEISQLIQNSFMAGVFAGLAEAKNEKRRQELFAEIAEWECEDITASLKRVEQMLPEIKADMDEILGKLGQGEQT
jgi:hypothetical protein